jgi:hypothetical protein
VVTISPLWSNKVFGSSLGHFAYASNHQILEKSQIHDIIRIFESLGKISKTITIVTLGIVNNGEKKTRGGCLVIFKKIEKICNFFDFGENRQAIYSLKWV